MGWKAGQDPQVKKRAERQEFDRSLAFFEACCDGPDEVARLLDEGLSVNATFSQSEDFQLPAEFRGSSRFFVWLAFWERQTSCAGC
jgi:hypothetical protein